MYLSNRLIRAVYLRACDEVLHVPPDSPADGSGEEKEENDRHLVCRAVFDMLLDCAGGLSASGMEHLWIRATFAREQVEGHS